MIRTGIYLSAALALAAAGCAEKTQLETVPVTGKVEYKGKAGKPASFYKNAKIVFQPDPQQIEEHPIYPEATIDPSSRSFEVRTYAKRDEPADGMPPGDYKVAIEWKEQRGSFRLGGEKRNLGSDLLKNKFTPKKTPLKVTINEDGSMTPPTIVVE